jgi:hypothetical protein
MINKINSHWGGMLISNPISTHVNMSNPSAGMVRYNVDKLEVYDGYSWLSLSYDATVDLTYDARQVLEWALKKMKEEQAIEKLKDNPTIADLLRQKADIEEKIKIVQILIKDHNGSDPA